MKNISFYKTAIASLIGFALPASAGPIQLITGELVEEPSGIPAYENIYALATGETGGQANIQIQVSEYAEQMTATIFMHAGPTPFTLSWLNNTVYYEGSVWHEQANQQGRTISVEPDSWNQIEWQINNLAHTITVKVDGELLASKTDQLPTWSTELDPGTISLKTDSSDGSLTWTDVVTATQGRLSVVGENDSPELGGDPSGEFSRIQAIGYSAGSGEAGEMSDAEKEAYSQSLLEMSRNLDPDSVKRALKKRQNRDHLSTDQGLFTPLDGDN